VLAGSLLGRASMVLGGCGRFLPVSAWHGAGHGAGSPLEEDPNG